MRETAKCKLGDDNRRRLCFSGSEHESRPPNFLRIPQPIDLAVNIPVDRNIQRLKAKVQLFLCALGRHIGE